MNGVHTGATWRIRQNRPCAAAMRPYARLLWPLVISVNVAYCDRPSILVCRYCLCRCVTLVNRVEVTEPIEMPNRLWAWMGLRNYVLDGRLQVLRDVAMGTIFVFLYMGWTFAPPGEYVRVWSCGLMSNYFDHLLLLGNMAVLRS